MFLKLAFFLKHSFSWWLQTYINNFSLEGTSQRISHSVLTELFSEQLCIRGKIKIAVNYFDAHYFKISLLILLSIIRKH